MGTFDGMYVAAKARFYDEKRNKVLVDLQAAEEKQLAKIRMLELMRDKVMPHLLQAQSELEPFGVTINLSPELDDINDPRLEHVMFQLDGVEVRDHTSVYRFSVDEHGEVLVYQCRQGLLRDDDRRLDLTVSHIDDLVPSKIEEIIGKAITEYVASTIL